MTTGYITMCQKSSYGQAACVATLTCKKKRAMIRQKIKEVAESKGMSQRKLSMRSGVDINTVRRLFRDPYATLNTVTLDKLAIALEVDASELIESVPPEEQ